MKHSIQQESTYSTNNVINASATANILLCKYIFNVFLFPTIFVYIYIYLFVIAKTEQCLNLNEISAVRPVSVIPQRRKRRRVNLKTELFDFFTEAQQAPQITNDSNESQNFSSDSSTSSASPIQELGYMDGLFPYVDDVFQYEKIKLIEDFPSIDDINDVFGINNNQQYCLITPTMSTLSFFA